ncbi:MAG TPA: hypothetical protein PLD73_02215 [Candidatus Hydrogenedentes bacterium]|jgi:tetratricopeptide (TPR) repeat protein|nr:hypothetical protein [Candidatus Hydrogenedentota bacterium]HPJ98199.1 hypothetical protein [Candidatus Hydrogenedentota bacterium]
MDLSRFKWPIIILVVIGVFWLFSSAGINFMHKKFTSVPPDRDAKVDQANEKGLSALGGLLIKTFRYEKGFEVLNDASRLYPQGANFWYNQYRMAKCLEKMDRISEALKLLDNLYVNDIHALDNRVPPRDVLKLRIDKLQEVHGLGEIQ